MPPRYAYWTILIGDEPTAFRAGAQEDLRPTFKRLQEKHPSAKMMWFQNGKLWNSRLDAQEAMRARGEMGRRGDDRQRGFRSRGDKPPQTSRTEKPEWKPRTSRPPAFARTPAGKQDLRTSQAEKLEWKPKGSAPPRSDRPSYPKAPGDKPAWRPKSHDRKPAWTGKPAFKRDGDRWDDRRKTSSTPHASSKLEWKPKGEGTSSGPPKRKWVPKEEYKKSKGLEARRDKNWRPGGEHKDPRQKYKDAKKAKWGRFKQTIRKRWESKKKSDK